MYDEHLCVACGKRIITNGVRNLNHHCSKHSESGRERIKRTTFREEREKTFNEKLQYAEELMEYD